MDLVALAGTLKHKGAWVCRWIRAVEYGVDCACALKRKRGSAIPAIKWCKKASSNRVIAHASTRNPPSLSRSSLNSR